MHGFQRHVIRNGKGGALTGKLLVLVEDAAEIGPRAPKKKFD